MKSIFQIISKSAYAIVVVFGFASCSNLDEVLYSGVTEDTYNYSADDLGGVIMGCYSPLNWGYVSAYWQTQELTGCCISTPANASGWDDGGIYKALQFHTWTSELGQPGDLWNNYYSGVILCNRAIEKLESGLIPIESEDILKSSMAELKTLRAYYHWILMDNFGNIPYITTTSQDLPEQTPRKDVYAALVEELVEEIPYLNDVQGEMMYGRMNKWAGKTLLANIYLNAQVYTGSAEWDKCLEQCNDIIESGVCALSPNFKDSFMATGVESSKEVIFTIPYDYERGVVGNYLYMNSWHQALKRKFLTNAAPNAAGGPKGITQFVETYDPDDSRIDDTWLRGPQYDVDGNPLMGEFDCQGQQIDFKKELPDGYFTNEMEGWRFNKQEVLPKTEWSSSADVPLFRYAEVLLMKAECLLRLGRPGAGAIVSELRERAFRVNPGNALVTDAELAQDSRIEWGKVENYEIVDHGDISDVEFGRLFDEWCWEFVWEGYTRRNMIRFGIFTTKTWLSHVPNGDYRIIFPIPNFAINSNSKLKQNTGY